MNARLQELEDLAEQAKSRANKLDKEKNKLMIEIREITTELEAVSTTTELPRLHNNIDTPLIPR